MLIKTGDDYFQKLRKAVDWKLLVFLLLFLNVKLAIKIPAIALIYILQFDFKFGFRFKNGDGCLKEAFRGIIFNA